MISWPLILIATTLVIFLLPLVPAMIELLNPTDVKPLSVSQAYDNTPFHFAEGFRGYIKKQFGDIHSAQNHNGRLPDGTKYQLVGEKGLPNLDATNITSKLLLSSHPLTLPAGETFEQEIYGAQAVLTGERSQFRAILSEGTLHLRDHATVLRWAHSTGEMAVGRGSRLFGRVTSNHSIILGDGVQFERLHAPRVLTTSAGSVQPAAPKTQLTELRELPDVKVHSGRRWVLNGGLSFPANYAFDGDIITAATAIIGENAHIKGAIKCNAANDVSYRAKEHDTFERKHEESARCELGNRVRVDGSIVSTHDLIIGQYCQIFGPVIAEGLLIIGAGTVIGTPESPTTVTAPRIIIEAGVTIHGTVWAEDGGIVRSSASEAIAA